MLSAISFKHITIFTLMTFRLPLVCFEASLVHVIVQQHGISESSQHEVVIDYRSCHHGKEFDLNHKDTQYSSSGSEAEEVNCLEEECEDSAGADHLSESYSEVSPLPVKRRRAAFLSDSEPSFNLWRSWLTIVSLVRGWRRNNHCLLWVSVRVMLVFNLSSVQASLLVSMCIVALHLPQTKVVVATGWIWNGTY